MDEGGSVSYNNLFAGPSERSKGKASRIPEQEKLN